MNSCASFVVALRMLSRVFNMVTLWSFVPFASLVWIGAREGEGGGGVHA